MNIKIVPFTDNHIKSAAALFTQNYQREKMTSPLLPDRNSTDKDLLMELLKNGVSNGGYAAFTDGDFTGYMLTGASFPFKGQSAVLSPEWAHGSVRENKEMIYRLLYKAIGEDWKNRRCPLHIIAHFAGDSELLNTLFFLGFGAFLAERLRNLEPVPQTLSYDIEMNVPLEKLIDLQVAHSRFYRDSPVFITKTEGPAEVLDELKEHLAEGDRFFTLTGQSDPSGFFIAGPAGAGPEGFLVRGEGTAQIKSAYIKPELRGRGAGTALLNSVIRWAEENHFQRLFVEHETANLFGGSFWGKYFDPYVYFSLRYIDPEC